MCNKKIRMNVHLVASFLAIFYTLRKSIKPRKNKKKTLLCEKGKVFLLLMDRKNVFPIDFLLSLCEFNFIFFFLRLNEKLSNLN